MAAQKALRQQVPDPPVGAVAGPAPLGEGAGLAAGVASAPEESGYEEMSSAQPIGGKGKGMACRGPPPPPPPPFWDYGKDLSPNLFPCPTIFLSAFLLLSSPQTQPLGQFAPAAPAPCRAIPAVSPAFLPQRTQLLSLHWFSLLQGLQRKSEGCGGCSSVPSLPAHCRVPALHVCLSSVSRAEASSNKTTEKLRGGRRMGKWLLQQPGASIPW